MRRLIGSLAVCAALTSCGTDEADPTAPADAAVTELTITVVAAEGADPTVMTLTCDPPGGDHPNVGAACAQLAEAGGASFEPVPADRACTESYGGPQTATVVGTYDGQRIDASFSRTNGCEIDRWDALGTEVFDVPLQ